MHLIMELASESWRLLADAAPYVLLGLISGGLLKAFLDPEWVARHLGRGRVKPVLKAALWGVPLPLCSCGVLPAAAALKKQGANSGATTAFVIATPESGADSIAISYALLDPILTVVRPLAAFITATLAGLAENCLGRDRLGSRQDAASGAPAPPAHLNLAAPTCGCRAATPTSGQEPAPPQGLAARLRLGLGYALGELWADLAPWFLLGLLLAGLVAVLAPGDLLARHLGGGISAMLLMLLLAVPLYVCATASTPIAAALILKGVSPGAALVFLLAGPATNLATLTVLVGLLGRRATAIYLASIVGCAVALGLAVDWLYVSLGISPLAVMGQAAELLPEWLGQAGAGLLLLLSLPVLARRLGSGLDRLRHRPVTAAGCGCSSGGCPEGPTRPH